MRLGYHDLLDALAEPGCAICRRAEEAVDDAIAGFLHEHVNDDAFRSELKASHGFCRPDAWRVVRHHDILGTALLYRSLLSASAGRRSRCWLCGVRESTEKAALQMLVERQADPEVIERLGESDGLCDDHFERLASISTIARAQRAARKRLAADLDELIRRQDYRFAHEPDSGERDAWMRAVAAINGLDVHALPRRRSAKLPPNRKDRGSSSGPDAAHVRARICRQTTR